MLYVNIYHLSQFLVHVHKFLYYVDNLHSFVLCWCTSSVLVRKITCKLLRYCLYSATDAAIVAMLWFSSWIVTVVLSTFSLFDESVHHFFVIHSFIITPYLSPFKEKIFIFSCFFENLRGRKKNSFNASIPKAKAKWTLWCMVWRRSERIFLQWFTFSHAASMIIIISSWSLVIMAFSNGKWLFSLEV